MIKTIIILSLFMSFTDKGFGQLFEFELNKGWRFSQQGKPEKYKATVPGVVHLDLMNNNIINDPYWENNELEQRWIENENWVYETVVELLDTLLEMERIELHFEGLDTYSKVYLNDSLILTSDNMFRSWDVNITEFAKQQNRLKIIFESPIKHNKEKVENSDYQLPSGNENDNIETKVSNYTRKAAYHFGWDWGPRFVTCGIWRPIMIRAWNSARITNASTSTLLINDSIAKMATIVEIEVLKENVYEIAIEGKIHSKFLKEGLNITTFEFEIKEPKLWWCNGYGTQHLYDQTISITSNNKLIESKQIKYGVRTIELINESDSIGTSFYFKLNGKPVFMKGANYIPQDMFIPRVKSEQTNRLITQVKNANMNMLRVWGGGVYEDDAFYSLCDKNGILVWQDFMFAGSLYPADPAFNENIKQEVIQNIKRLRPHPCIALWCGNNEIEVAWNNWGWQKQFGYTSEDSIEIWNNYKFIFEEMIPELVKEHTTTNYTSTSPQSNWGTKENFNHSSMHYWGVWHGKEPFTNFTSNVGRFMVEYGFQSFPERSTLKKVMSDSSLSLTSTVMKNRQKSYIGNGLILEHIKRNFQEPDNFEEFIMLSQKTQAKAMQIAIQAHIRKQPHCMGSLFWQLNDCWPGPSWSVIDYYGKEKQAYNVVKMEYSMHP